MNRKLFTITLMALLVLLLSVGGATGQGPGPERRAGPLAAETQPQGEASIAATVNSRISYQGMLKEDGAPVTGERDMTFRLYSNDPCFPFTQVGSDIVKDDVPVTNGLFSVKLDVDQSDFDGLGLWLEVLVGGTTVVSCDEILPAPYALSLRPGADIVGTARGQSIIYAENESDALLSKGVHGKATAGSGATFGVLGESVSTSGTGVFGRATAGSGATYGVKGESVSASGSGVYGTAPKCGLRGYASASSGTTYGVRGTSNSPSGTGVYGFASGQGVFGDSGSSSGIGVRGKNASDGIGVRGLSSSGIGVLGLSYTGVGVKGAGLIDDGVYGETWSDAAGVHGVAFDTFGETYGVRGESPSGNDDGYGGYFVGYNGVYGEATNDLGYAAVFSGTARTQVLEITGGSDLSEQFDVTAAEGEVTPGLVVCIDANHPGRLLVCTKAYDRTVAGVVSGAGGIEPGMVMGQRGSPADGAYPVALTGRVYVWADASEGSIRPGDLLTTSDTPGHVIKVSDYAQAQGAIIGKAMSSLDQGQGLILVLVSLQ
ncbi:MAG: hypothetical protein IMY86_09525 [Chloroflexi bacterium]|nr:hypothetical protein [Chloroflexota bacterium]